MQPERMSRFALHEGQALMAVAQTYPFLLEVILENIQNAIDANALRIWVTLNFNARHLTVRDNGDGVTQAQFEQALVSVCATIKAKDKLGRFGRGLVSPLGKCDYFCFTSQPRRGGDGYLEWTFSTKELSSQESIPGIPVKARTDLVFEGKSSAGVTAVPWRTEVKLHKFTVDRVISKVSMDSLEDDILARYSVPMRRRGVTVLAKIIAADGQEEERKIQAKKFAGRALKEVECFSDDAGRTLFRLFLANMAKKGRQGKVLTGELGDDFRITFSDFVKGGGSTLLEKETVEALVSGIFEGEILSGKAQLHPSRTKFGMNDALLGMCVHIEQWYQQHGRQYRKEAETERQSERYQGLGRRSLKVIEYLLKEAKFKSLLDLIKSFGKGTVGGGHAKVPADKVVGPQDQPAISTAGVQTPVQPGDESENTRRKTPQELEEHTPLTVTGPAGKRRTVVRSNSLGLQVEYEKLSGTKLWELDVENGIFHINVRHPLFEACAERDTTLMKFQEYLMLQGLTLHSMPEEWQEVQRALLDEMLEPFVFCLLNGDRLAGRTPGRKPGEAPLKAVP